MEKPPSRLGKHGKRLWKELVPWLQGQGMEVVDNALVESVCQAYEIMCKANDAMDSVGAHDESHPDRPRRHPLFQVWRDSYSAYLRGMRELGCTPAARKQTKKDEGGDDRMRGLLSA